jgi:drug/metabolite transporter (DMT)-like permease
VAYFVNGETPTVSTLIGGTLAIAGVVIVSKFGKPSSA